MQKIFILHLLCCLSCFYSAAQHRGTSLAFINEDTESSNPMSISVREVLTDTVIKGHTFRKLKWLTFTDYEKEKTIDYQYEHFAGDRYLLLDRRLKPIHDFKLDREQQQGVVFGKKGTVLRMGINMEGDGIGKDLTNDDYDCDIRFYVQGADSRYLQFNHSLGKIRTSQDGKSEQQSLHGSEGVLTALQNQPFRAGYYLSKGDEVQFVLQGLDTDPETGKEGLVDTDLLLYCYRGDTLIDGQKQLIITGVNYSFEGKSRRNFEMLVRPVEDGLYLDHKFIPVPVFETTFRIDNTGKNNRKKLNAALCIYDTLDGQVVPRYFGNSYEKTVFPLFPAFFPTYGKRITYLKRDGKVYGENRLPGENSIVSITKEGDNLRVGVATSVTGRIRVLLYDDGKPSVVYDLEEPFSPGKDDTSQGNVRYLKFKIPALQKGKTYRLEVEFDEQGSRNMVSREFIAE